MSRIVAGVIGWLVGTVPLVVVNIVSVENLLDQRAALAWGAVALLGGIALGGVAAGAFGARAERGGDDAAGIMSAGLAGGLAALLFVATLLGLLVGASRLGIAPTIIAAHPIRVTLAIVSLAALLVLIALLAGTLASRLRVAALAGGRPAGAQPARGAPSRPRPPHRPYANTAAAPYRPGPPSMPVAPRPASDTRPEQRYRPPSGPAPRSVPRSPTGRQDPPRR